MNNKIGVSISIFHKHYTDNQLNEIIKEASKLDIDIIEILFARPFMFDIDISEEN